MSKKKKTKNRFTFRVIDSLGEDLNFDTLYRNHWRPCYNQALRIFSTFPAKIQTAEDVTQDAFLKIFKTSYKCDILLSIKNTLNYEREDDPTLFYVAKASGEAISDYFKYHNAAMRNKKFETSYSYEDFMETEGDIDESLFLTDIETGRPVSGDALLIRRIDSDLKLISNGIVEIVDGLFDFSTKRSTKSIELILAIFRFGLDKESLVEYIGDIKTLNGLNSRISSFSKDLMESDIEIGFSGWHDGDDYAGYDNIADLIKGVSGTGKRKELTDTAKFTRFINTLESLSYYVLMVEESKSSGKDSKCSLEAFKDRMGHSPLFLLAVRSDRKFF